MDRKYTQLELELEEMQSRVSKLEEFFTILAKWTKFPTRLSTENDGSDPNIENCWDEQSINFYSNPQNSQEGIEMDEAEFAYKIDIDDDERNDFKLEVDDHNGYPGSPQNPFELSDSSTKAEREPIKRRGNADFAPNFHEIQTRVPCPKCPKTLKHKQSLGKHMREVHKIRKSNKKPIQKKIKANENFKCYFCSRIYTDTGNLQKHISLHTQEHLYSCTKSAKSQKIGVNEYPHKCPYCSQATRRRSNLSRHIRAAHMKAEPQQMFECYFCPKIFRRYQDLKRHLVIHTTERHFKCARCPFTTGIHSSLMLHNQSKHRVNAIRAGYKAERGNDGKLQYKCPHCSYRTTGVKDPYMNLDSHIASLHTAEDGKQLQCKICKKKFALRKLLMDHVRIHEKRPEKTVLCHHCPFVTRKQTSLKSHIRQIHEGIKEEDYFQCYFCPRKMAYFNTYSNHLRTHTGEFPYVCHLCPYRTSNPSGLCHHKKKAHPADLTGRNFKCAKCQSTFKSKRDLKLHAKFHRKF